MEFFEYRVSGWGKVHVAFRGERRTLCGLAHPEGHTAPLHEEETAGRCAACTRALCRLRAQLIRNA